MVDANTQDAAVEVRSRGRRKPWLLIAGLVVAVLVATVLGVLLAIGTESSAKDVPVDVEAAVDAYTEAIVAGDAEQWLETVTDDFFHRRYIYGKTSHEQIESFNAIENSSSGQAYRIEYYGSIDYEQLGELSVAGDGPWFVSVGQVWTEVPDAKSGQLLVFEGTATYVVVERPDQFDGLRVDAELFTGTVAIVEDN